MVSRLVFHLGDHKTGSTSIQNVLARGAIIGPAPKILYPRIPPAQGHHNQLARTLLRGRNRAARRAEQFEALAACIAESDAEIAVVSGEAFERVDPAQLRAALEQYLPDHAASARFITYLRPHGPRLLASYAERVKQGLFDGTLEEFLDLMLERGELHYHPRVTRWREVFGARFALRPMIRVQLHGQCVIRDFLRFATGREDLAPRRTPDANPTLGVEDLTVLRALQRRLAAHKAAGGAPVREAARSTGWRLARMLAHHPPETITPLRVHRALAERLVAAYRDDAAAVDGDFFTGAPLAEALEALPGAAIAAPQTLRPEDHLPPEAQRQLEIWSSFVEQMFCHDPSGWPAYFKSNPLVLRDPPG